MASVQSVPIETLVRSNEKLLKALITLLSLKDEHLLDEMRTIFAMAGGRDETVGTGDAKVMAEIRRELGLVSDLVDRLNAMPEGAEDGAAKG